MTECLTCAPGSGIPTAHATCPTCRTDYARPAPKPPVILVQPEVIATLDRIATAFEAIATRGGLADDAPEDRMCGAAIWHRRDAGQGVPLVCNRDAGHGPGCVARDEDGNVLACTLGRPPVAPEGWVCPACGEGAEVARG